MTTTLALDTRAPARRQGFANAFRAEATKLRSLRSTTWALLVTVAGGLLITGLIANHQATRGNHNYQGFDPTNMALAGLAIAALSIGVLGVLAISGEYGTGTIRSSLSAVPQRRLFIASKLAVVGLLSFVVGEALAFSCFFLGQGILHGSPAPTASLGQPNVARAVIMTGAFLALLALFALGLGLIIRHSAGAIAAFVGATLLLPILLQGLGSNASKFAPVNIFTNSVSTTVTQQGNSSLSATTGFLFMVGYTVAVLALGTTLFLRRDA